MVKKIDQAVIMVGGMGTRLRPLTETCPTPVLPILDKPCLMYLIESIARAGVKEIILACGYRSQQLKDTIGDGSHLGIDISYSYEDELAKLIVNQKRNVLEVTASSSVVLYNGKPIELKSVAVYVDKNNTFYLPRNLKDVFDKKKRKNL